MSALCQKRTQNLLFDHLVGSGEHGTLGLIASLGSANERASKWQFLPREFRPCL
jgi:hypothetical protein